MAASELAGWMAASQSERHVPAQLPQHVVHRHVGVHERYERGHGWQLVQLARDILNTRSLANQPTNAEALAPALHQSQVQLRIDADALGSSLERKHRPRSSVRSITDMEDTVGPRRQHERAHVH